MGGREGGELVAGVPPAGTPEGRARNTDFVQSLERGLAVIGAFGPDRPSLTLTQVAEITGLNRAAARRFLLTLVDLGYMRSDARRFSLSPKVLELGFAYLSGLSLPQLALPLMEDLVAHVHESSSISVLDGEDIVYVVRVPTARIMSVTISIGTRFPAFCTSMGRVLLAAKSPARLDDYLRTVSLGPRTTRTVRDAGALRTILEQVAEEGFALVEQELEDGLISIAVPIRNASGVVIAAINVSANASRVRATTMRRDMLPALARTAARIELAVRAVNSHSGRGSPPAR
jgi:IclR family transcriptional regulator, pca regulon regulatory protein